MKFTINHLLFMSFLISGCTGVKNTGVSQKDFISPPVADKKPFDVGLHGEKRIDDYYWMNDYFKKGPDSTKVLEYLNAENNYLDTVLADVRDLRDTLFIEMKGRIKERDESVPVFKNGYFYYTRYEQGKQYPIHCRKKGNLSANEEILLDVNTLAADHPYYEATGLDVSPDNRILAFAVDTVSRRQYTYHFKNLETNEVFNESIFPVTGSGVWANDSKTFFYTETNPLTLLTEKIRRHKLGTNASVDVTVFQELDKSNYMGLEKTKSGKFIVINSHATLSSEMQYLDADNPDDSFKVFQPRIKDVLYNIEEHNGRFLIRTNWNATNFRLMESPLDQTSIDNWKEVIPHNTEVLFESFHVFKDFIAISERKNGLMHLRIRNNNNEEHYINFAEPAYSLFDYANPDYHASNLRYLYTSLTTPLSVIEYNVKTREKKVLKEQEVIGGYTKENYVTERLFAEAPDGVKVPITIVYRKDFKKNGSSPLLLYGYGSYGISMDPVFSGNRLSLIDRGFAIAIAHIRGGQEMGRKWYEDGRQMKKKNSFTDFIAAAQYLVKEKFTSPAHLYAEGGSAGGLLMGAIANIRPDLFNGITAKVPFVDVVTTMMDESIPLTTNEFDEWGNPKQKEAYEYMKSYSPYDNVAKKDYPNILVTTGLHDSQVQYFEPAKWVAKLREMKTDNNLLLLHTNMEFGHGGASGRFDYLKDIALVYAFFLKLEGIRK